MATPLTADAIVAALKAEGVHVAEHTGWRAHNRDGETGKTFGPVSGVVIHHTAGTNSLALCYNGRPDLPGPLCHTHLAKDGTATMVGHGRANHAGTFAQNAVDAVVNESTTHPRPDEKEPVDGNDRFYGIEIENLGDNKDPYPAVQYDAAVRWAAALCRAHKWSADSVIGHKEGTRRKTDPSFSMAAFRDDLAQRLTHPAGWNPNDPQEDDVPLTDTEIKKVAAATATATVDRLLAGGGALETNDITRVATATATAVADKLGSVTLTDAQVQTIAASPVLADAIAERVAVKLAARLAS